MAWLGESFNQIKGQISNFTKEVLAEGQEEREGFAESDELKAARRFIVELESRCLEHGSETEQLRLQVAELQERSEASERQTKSVVESYQNLIHTKDEENTRLRGQVDELQKLLDARVHESTVVTSFAKEADHVARPEIEIQDEQKYWTENTKSQIQTVDVSTTTEESDYDESYVRELEERCSSYQNELYELRAQLLSLQSDLDQSEESSANLNDQISQILHSDFIIDGNSVLPLKFKHPAHIPDENHILITTLKKLSSVWKDLVEKKATLERTVAKLSAQKTYNSLELKNVTENISSPSVTPIDFFPPKVDSFGLETIIEDERGEEDGRSCEVEVIDEPSKIAFIDKPCNANQKSTLSVAVSKDISSSYTQTDQVKEKTAEELHSEIFASIESAFLEREKDWILKVEERENHITKLEADLDRLKTHLVDLEEQYTNDSLITEESEKQLRHQIAELQKEITQSLLENERNGDSRDEIVRLAAERDFARSQNLSLEDQLQKLNGQLQNLHFVLEQFQKEKELDIAGIERATKAEIVQLQSANEALKKELEIEKGLLEKARFGLDAAHQLNLQIEEKTRIITQLKNQVQEKEAEVFKLKSQMEEVANNLDGKIDRYLVKNLIVGYFSSPGDKRKEVLRIIATVLDFNREDRQKTGLEATSLWSFRTDSSGDKQSLSEAFIKFLENESQPKVEMRIPVEEMTRRNSRSSGSSTPAGSSSVSGDSSAPRNSTPPAPGVSEISMSLPVFNQSDRSNSILKDVLNPRT